jgi:aldehyde:ferredoxin oxidoreductase
MHWGNVDGSRELLRKIATRQGLGKILAEGTMRASRKIGGEAVNMGVYTMKGNTPRGHDHRNRWPMILDTSVAQIGTDEGTSMMASAAEALGISIKPVGANSSPEDILSFNASHAQCKGAAHFEDCLGVCRFNTRTDLILLSKALSAATGWDFPLTETMEVGKRIVNLMRVFNVRHGHTAEMDAPSPRYSSIPVDGPSKGKGIMVYFDDMRRSYYKQMGWDEKTGIPLPETLKKFGLEFAVADLKKK